MKPTDSFDCLLVGGGLANGLIALALLDLRPDVRVALIEQGERLGGNHTWSFHESDLDAAGAALVAPLVGARWPAYEVAFPHRERRLHGGYASVFSYDLDRALRRAFDARRDCALLSVASARSSTARSVELDGGRHLAAPCVFDGRGPSPEVPSLGGGYQKFFGIEVRLSAPAPRSLPLLMDARVAQLDGFRFLYVLPFEEDRVLLEDTTYSTSPALDRRTLRVRLFEYAAAHGYRIHSVLREESGVLPIPIRAAASDDPSGPVRVGWRGGFFHPTTGYSLPWAARLATRIAAHALDEFPGAVRAFARELAPQARFARWLNRLLFGAFAPTERIHVFERFYGLPEETIARFYALRTTPLDRSRILCGRPPRGFSVRQLIAGETPA